LRRNIDQVVNTTSSGQTWDERYSEEDFAFGTEPNDFLREVVDRLPVGRTLCLGDGEGRNGVFLAERGHRVVTLDLSPVGVLKARRLAAERGVAIDARVADLAQFEFADRAWDCIVSIFCHLPAPLRLAVHGAVPRALAAGGCFVLEAYRKANIGRGVGGPQSAEMTLELEEVLTGSGVSEELEIVIGREVERNIVEGRYHNGMSATTQVLARRRSVRHR
jgi:SAM-dependent methyltransferase